MQDGPNFLLLNSFLNRFEYQTERAEETEDRAVALAVLAQFYNQMHRPDEAAKKYTTAIALFKRLEALDEIPYRPGGNIHQLYAGDLMRTEIALARLHCQLEQLEEAEKL